MTDTHLPLVALALVLIGVPLALVGLGSWAVVRARSTAVRLFAGTLAAGSALFLGLIVWMVVQIGPGRSGVVVSGESPGGREFCVVQTYKGLIEPYRVSLYVRDDSGLWRWHYLEHEGDAWRSARVEITGGRAVVHRNGERFTELELARGVAEPEVIRSNGYVALKTLSAELTVEDVARLHHEKYRR